MIIDLRSDTLTKPSPDMLAAMMKAEVGDDVFNEDYTINKLEDLAAGMFGMEAGIFCPSGTMTNQIAVKIHTQPLDEVICDKLCHIYNYEVGGFAFHSGVSVRLTDGDRGIMTVAEIEKCILPDYDWYPNTRLVCIENTVNKGGGAVYTIEQMKAIGEFCKNKGLAYHLDGARIFNALTALGKKSNDLSGIFDTISVCISKGLGAPVGSVLLGPRDLIKKARKVRKVMGGGMRQAGYLAAACIFAMEHNVDRLSEDHNKAKQIEAILKQCKWVKEVLPVETNIVIFDVENSADTAEKLTSVGIRSSPFSPTLVRMVTHLDISNEMMIEFEKKIKEIALTTDNS
jgi:threonine aldolase